MMQLIFFAASLVVLLLGHIFFGYILVKLFPVGGAMTQMIIGVLIMFLFLSTIVSSYLIHKWDTVFTRWYYMFSAFWIGVLANFGIMSVLVLLLKLFAWNTGFVFPPLSLRMLFFGGTAVLSIYGLSRAWTPKVTNYEVSIKDLPEAWNNKVVVQISDVHLGPVYRERFFGRLLAHVQTLNPEAVFITGDLFDGMETDFTWLNHPFTKLQVPKGIYYSFGNHDLYLGFNRAMELLKGNPVVILDNKMVVVDGLQIIGINYSFNKDFDLEAAILKQVSYDKLKPSILLFHEPKNIALAKNAEIDLQLSGHTHGGQLFPFNYLAKLSYKGYSYGLFNDGDFSLVVNRGAGTWGPPMRTCGQSEIIKITLRKK